jgi:TRAP-type transport system periplasmic protein
MKRELIRINMLVYATVFLIVAFASTTNLFAEKVTIKYASSMSPTHSTSVAIKMFGEMVSKKTDGELQVKLYPGSQLGGEREIVEGVQMGTIDMGNGGFIGKDYYDLFFLNYLFRDRNHMLATYNSPLGERFKNQLLKETGIRVLAYLEKGVRLLTTTKKIVTKPEDMKGFKLRVMQIEYQIAQWKDIGAAPTPMAFPELFMGLQQGTVEGQDNPADLIYASALYEVQKNLVLTKHSRNQWYMLINDKFFNKLSDAHRSALQTSAIEVSKYMNKLVPEEEDKYVKMLKEKGMTVIEPDVQAFYKAFQVSTKTWADKRWGKGIYEEINNIR